MKEPPMLPGSPGATAPEPPVVSFLNKYRPIAPRPPPADPSAKPATNKGGKGGGSKGTSRKNSARASPDIAPPPKPLAKAEPPGNGAHSRPRTSPTTSGASTPPLASSTPTATTSRHPLLMYQSQVFGNRSSKPWVRTSYGRIHNAESFTNKRSVPAPSSVPVVPATGTPLTLAPNSTSPGGELYVVDIPQLERAYAHASEAVLLTDEKHRLLWGNAAYHALVAKSQGGPAPGPRPMPISLALYAFHSPSGADYRAILWTFLHVPGAKSPAELRPTPPPLSAPPTSSFAPPQKLPALMSGPAPDPAAATAGLPTAVAVPPVPYSPAGGIHPAPYGLTPESVYAMLPRSGFVPTPSTHPPMTSCSQPGHPQLTAPRGVSTAVPSTASPSTAAPSLTTHQPPALQQPPPVVATTATRGLVRPVPTRAMPLGVASVPNPARGPAGPPVPLGTLPHPIQHLPMSHHVGFLPLDGGAMVGLPVPSACVSTEPPMTIQPPARPMQPLYNLHARHVQPRPIACSPHPGGGYVTGLANAPAVTTTNSVGPTTPSPSNSEGEPSGSALRQRKRRNGVAAGTGKRSGGKRQRPAEEAMTMVPSELKRVASERTLEVSSVLASMWSAVL